MLSRRGVMTLPTKIRERMHGGGIDYGGRDA
jgi:hypothetical protein